MPPQSAGGLHLRPGRAGEVEHAGLRPLDGTVPQEGAVVLGLGLRQVVGFYRGDLLRELLELLSLLFRGMRVEVPTHPLALAGQRLPLAIVGTPVANHAVPRPEGTGARRRPLRFEQDVAGPRSPPACKLEAAADDPRKTVLVALAQDAAGHLGSAKVAHSRAMVVSSGPSSPRVMHVSSNSPAMISGGAQEGRCCRSASFLAATTASARCRNASKAWFTSGSCAGAAGGH
jgi:hypothetical protein